MDIGIKSTLEKITCFFFLMCVSLDNLWELVIKENLKLKFFNSIFFIILTQFSSPVLRTAFIHRNKTLPSKKIYTTPGIITKMYLTNQQHELQWSEIRKKNSFYL